MTGPTPESDFQQCDECGHRLSERAAKLSDDDGCLWCEGDDL